jgi:hypothetical protein
MRQRCLVDDASIAKEDHPVGPRSELGVEGNHHGGHATMTGGQDQAHDCLGVGGVERAGGLVSEKQLPSADHGAGGIHFVSRSIRVEGSGSPVSSNVLRLERNTGQPFLTMVAAVLPG